MAKQLPWWPLSGRFPSITTLQEGAAEQYCGSPSIDEEISVVQAALPSGSFMGTDAAKRVLFFKFWPELTKAAEHARLRAFLVPR